MRTPLLVMLACLTLAVSSAFAARPVEGYYVGTVKVTRSLFLSKLSTSYTLKAQAEVDAEGKIVTLTATPEFPADAADLTDLTKGFNFAVPVTGIWPLILNPPTVESGQMGNNYVVDSKHAGYLTLKKNTFTLHFTHWLPSAAPDFSPSVGVIFSFKKTAPP